MLKRKKILNRDDVIDLCEQITEVMSKVNGVDNLDLFINALNAVMAIVIIKGIKEESFDAAFKSIAED